MTASWVAITASGSASHRPDGGRGLAPLGQLSDDRSTHSDPGCY